MLIVAMQIGDRTNDREVNRAVLEWLGNGNVNQGIEIFTEHGGKGRYKYFAKLFDFAPVTMCRNAFPTRYAVHRPIMILC